MEKNQLVPKEYKSVVPRRQGSNWCKTSDIVHAVFEKKQYKSIFL